MYDRALPRSEPLSETDRAVGAMPRPDACLPSVTIASQFMLPDCPNFTMRAGMLVLLVFPLRVLGIVMSSHDSLPTLACATGDTSGDGDVKSCIVGLAGVARGVTFAWLTVVAGLSAVIIADLTATLSPFDV